MGKAIIVLKVFPAEGANLEDIQAQLKKLAGFNDSRIEPFVFGSKIVKVSFIYEDGAKNIDFEEEINKLTGVSGCQVEEESLL